MSASRNSSTGRTAASASPPRSVRKQSPPACAASSSDAPEAGASQTGQEATFHVDHVVPRTAGGQTHSRNLALACVSCSLRKEARQSAADPRTGKLVPLFNPRRQHWAEHFRWDGVRLVGISATGRATVARHSGGRTPQGSSSLIRHLRGSGRRRVQGWPVLASAAASKCSGGGLGHERPVRRVRGPVQGRKGHVLGTARSRKRVRGHAVSRSRRDASSSALSRSVQAAAFR